MDIRDWVWSGSFSSDGLRIVSAGRDKTVRVWSAQTHQQIGDPFRTHRSGLVGVREFRWNVRWCLQTAFQKQLFGIAAAERFVWRSKAEDAGAN